MKSTIKIGITAIALTTGAIALAGAAAAAPAGPSQVTETVDALKAKGYSVIVNQTGSGSLDSCAVQGVRQGVVHETMDARGSTLEPMTISRTVYVDVSC